MTVVGCSPAWPNPGGAHSGYLVTGGEGNLLLDCGPGVLTRLRELQGWPRVDAIVVTHFHLDHWGDLVPWVWGTFFGAAAGGAHPELWLPPSGPAELDHFACRLGQEGMFERAFRLRIFEPEVPFSAAGLEVTPVRVPHYQLETYGLRVTNGERTFAYSGDSAPSEQLVRLARDADLFLCEATLADGASEGLPRGHLSAEEAVEAARAAGARRLVLTHRPHELPLSDGLEQAHEGLVLDV